MSFTNPLTEAQQIAEAVGVIIGAASHCDHVTEERLKSTADKLHRVVLSTALDDADARAASELFSVAVEAGRSAAERGKIDPEVAETALCEMEEQLAV
jgi:hypothetical protein